MKWHRRLFALEKDPYGTSKEPGTLHQLTLTAQEPGKVDFDYSTMMYIPRSMESQRAALSLELFEDEGRTQLLHMLDKWRGRDVKRKQFVV